MNIKLTRASTLGRRDLKITILDINTIGTQIELGTHANEKPSNHRQVNCRLRLFWCKLQWHQIKNERENMTLNLWRKNAI